MTKTEFLTTLRHKLRTLPQEDIEDAVEYYDSYINDAEMEETAAIERLGPPGEIAAQILADFAIQEPGSPDKQKRGLGMALSIILAIFALPIGLPIAIAIAAVAFSLLITLLALLFSFFICAAALLITGVLLIVLTPVVLFQSITAAVVALGQGLLSLGIGILMLKLTKALLQGGTRFITKFVGKRIVRRRK